MRTFYIETYGCQMNFYDSQVIDDVLQGMGLQKVERAELSDLILINTCSVRDNAEQRVRGRVNQLWGERVARRQEGMIGLLGCMAQRLGESLLQEKHSRLDFVVGTDQYQRLPEIIEMAVQRKPSLYFTDFDHVVTYEAQPKSMPPGGSHYLAVMHGCDKFCSYCIVPFTRGRERSKPMDTILREARSISEAGGFEITLLGQTISSYQEGGDNFISLLRKVSDIDGIKRIRFMTSYPTDLNEKVFDAIAALPKVESRIHLPVQSGSDRILKRMNRHYDLAQYEAILNEGRKRIEGLQFSTDLIVGFPGERDDDFRATLQLMDRQEFVSSFLFKYSPREGTLACRSEDDVPESVKSERLARLMELQEATTARLLQAQLGEELEILLDEESKKAKNQLRGRTRNNMRVIVDPKEGTAIGDFALARITGFRGETLTGELL